MTTLRTTLTLTSSDAAGIRVDALVVAAVRGPKGPVLVGAPEALEGAYGRGGATKVLQALGAKGEADEVTKLPSPEGVAAPVLVVVGLGEQRKRGYDDAAGREVLRRAAGAAVRRLAGTGKVALALPGGSAGETAAVAEGALLGAYSFDRYRTTEGRPEPVGALTVVSPSARERATKDLVERARILVEAVTLARDLVNMPPADLPPAALAQVAVDGAEGRALQVQVLDEKALRKGGYGGILGVGQGSSRPPRLVKISYTHRDATRHLALVGKGITFDSGGLSLKPAKSMEWMKSDMGGAAAVIAALQAVADRDLPVNVTGWAPLAENMPSGTAQRPSDVLTIYGGKTVEVLNTDAEGRLVLADAIVAASEEQPDLIVDVATLTGAQLVALGSRTSAIMSNDDGLRGRVHEVANDVGESMWPMPLPPELRKSMDSQVADIANMGDRYGGMLVAGLFLQEFVGEGIRWAHLDIAGPAFNEGEPYGYTPKGGTGAAVRTLVTIAEEMAGGTI